ncbi:hypothetical protein LZD49_28645 [Dyadobacter sp. CY261]|uniref:hypothetical protein n=1 Tax=Dyadobacter sp. CY261 TaxID=2907203 RepID=UPI001F32767F|nr:hypothetical protein [Dyadobacter sp. CY261]MCF0074488.1 hypothetical protein [Dyadobacter sp. CY261]
MANTEKKTLLAIDYFSLNFSLQAKDAEGQQVILNDSVGLNFNDDNELNRVLVEKPYLKAIIQPLIHRLKESYDPTKADAKKLKEDIGKLLQ